jgi:hypothetical protein
VVDCGWVVDEVLGVLGVDEDEVVVVVPCACPRGPVWSWLGSPKPRPGRWGLVAGGVGVLVAGAGGGVTPVAVVVVVVVEGALGDGGVGMVGAAATVTAGVAGGEVTSVRGGVVGTGESPADGTSAGGGVMLCVRRLGDSLRLVVAAEGPNGTIWKRKCRRLSSNGAGAASTRGAAVTGGTTSDRWPTSRPESSVRGEA